MMRYEAYKDSGVEWIGDIPEGWETKKIKYLFQDNSSVYIDGDWIESKDIFGEDVYYFTTGNIQELNFKERDFALISEETFKKLNCTEIIEGDLLVSRLNLPLGRTCIAPKFDKKAIVAVDVVIFRCDNSYNRRFLLYLMNSSNYFLNNENEARGAIMKRISRSLLGNVKIPIPPLSEQTAIAEFLDDKTAKIDQTIAIRQKEIELLKERRQILIQQAVTKGLDATVPMKDSGVDWIGEIPAHWEVRKFKFLCHITTGSKNTENKIENGLYPFYVRSQTPERINSYTFDGEAILTAGDGAGVGKVFHYVNEKFDFHQRVYKFSRFRDVKGKFLYYYLKKNFYNVALNGEAKSTVDSLRLPLIQNFPVSFPKIDEQTQIVSYLEDIEAKIAKAISIKEQEIEKLKEYKTVLIDRVVTGKVKIK